MSRLLNVTSILKYLLALISMTGLLIAALLMLFGFLSTFEDMPFNWLYRIIYFLGLASSLGSVIYLAQTMANRFANKANEVTITKKIMLVIAITGLMAAFIYALIFLRVMINFMYTFSDTETFPVWYAGLITVTAASCLATAGLFFRRLLMKNESI